MVLAAPVVILTLPPNPGTATLVSIVVPAPIVTLLDDVRLLSARVMMAVLALLLLFPANMDVPFASDKPVPVVVTEMLAVPPSDGVDSSVTPLLVPSETVPPALISASLIVGALDGFSPDVPVEMVPPSETARAAPADVTAMAPLVAFMSFTVMPVPPATVTSVWANLIDVP